MFATAHDLVKSKLRRFGTLNDAQAYLQQVLEDALNNKQGNKENRPWHIVDFSTKLDKDQPWIGFEFETGFDNKEEYQKFIHWLWKQKYVAIDREGTGKYPVEVAFPPQTLDGMLKNKHLLQKSVEFIRRNKLTPALNPTTFTRRDVGIHAGISTPKFRAAKYDDKTNAVHKLHVMLNSLTSQQRVELYGRHALHWGTANMRTEYVELKMFKAIPEVDRVKGYIDVTIRCVHLLDWCLDNPKKRLDRDQVYAYLSGDTAVIDN